MPDFISGLALARDFYATVVRQAIDVPHAAALLGEGSEVLGYDQPRSTDHAWGPRLQVFVRQPEQVDVVTRSLDARLPSDFRGWPVRFFSWETNSVRHHVDVTLLGNWIEKQIGLDPLARELTTADWLAFPQQKLDGDDQGVLVGALAWRARGSSHQTSGIRRQRTWRA